MKKLFGTNGVRGVFSEDFTLEFVNDLVMSLAAYFKQGKILVGYDGRHSSPIVAKVVSSALNYSGLDCYMAGLVPTPCLEYATKKLGYDGIELIGWAQPPYYDNTTKKLHWAKELHFEHYETNTLNYNIRVLGRKGFLTMNVIGEMNVLPMVQNDLDPILSSVEFNEGNRYADFNPDIDTVAAYGIGGLIAGKILAKAGFFALILKFWKVIAIGVVGAFGIFKKKIFGSKSDSTEV